MTEPQKDQNPETDPKLTILDHLICSWALVVLVLTGGIAGGMFGGLAYGANMALFKHQELEQRKKYLISGAISLGAFVLFGLFMMMRDWFYGV